MEKVKKYLISKDNKNNVSFVFTKKDLKTGDIVKIINKYYYVVLKEDFSKVLKVTSNHAYVKAFTLTSKEGFFIHVTEHGPNGRSIRIEKLDDYDNNLSTKDGPWIKEIYPGNIDLSNIDNLYIENIEKETYNRKKILPQWRTF